MCNTTHPRKAHYFTYQLNSKAKSTLATYQCLATEPYVYCKVFEDNSGALELARLPKLRPRSKHINVCYHHFREHIETGLSKSSQ
jgi:hypothetical protein